MARPVEADAHLVRPGVLSLLIAGQSYRVVLDPDTTEPALHLGPQRIPYRIDDPRSLRGSPSPRRLRWPRHTQSFHARPRRSRPGRKGDTVAAHQGILVVEAMKMQNEMQSPRDGRVREIRVAPGDTVSAGDILAIIE